MSTTDKALNQLIKEFITMENNELSTITRLEHGFILHAQKRITKSLGILAAFELCVIIALIAMEVIL